MEVLFADRKLYMAAHSRHDAIRVLGSLGDRYLSRLDMILAADSLEGLKAIRSLHLHPLKGDRRGQWGIDLNRNYRLVLSVEGETVIVESVEDYHGE